MERYCVVLNHTGIRGFNFNEKDEIVKESEIMFQKTTDFIHIDFVYALDIIKNLIIKNCDKSKDLELGISVPGVVDYKKNKILTESIFTNIDVNIEEYFKDLKFIKKVCVENDGNAFALGEYNYGTEKDLNNSLFISIKTGIAGASIINGKLLRGHNFSAGEFSRSFANIEKKDIVDEWSIFCGTLQLKYRYAIKKNISISTVHMQDLIRLYEEGNDEIVNEIFDIWTSSIAKLIININLVLNVNFLVLNGSSTTSNKFLDEIKIKTSELSRFINIKEPNIIRTSLNNNAEAYGVLSILKGKN